MDIRNGYYLKVRKEDLKTYKTKVKYFYCGEDEGLACRAMNSALSLSENWQREHHERISADVLVDKQVRYELSMQTKAEVHFGDLV